MPEEPDLPESLSFRERLTQRPVTMALMAVCILAYAATFTAALATSADPSETALQSLWSLAGSEQALARLGALELTRVWLDHEWWRVLTTGLLHGSLLHLVLNMLALNSIGEWVEQAWGPWRTLLLFLVSSVAGCLASLVWCESTMVVGASAGVLGQAGALWIARRFGSPELQARLAPISVLTLGILILLCLFLGTVVAGIAQAGHVGGLLAGGLLGWPMADRRHPWRWLVTGPALALALAALVWVGRVPDWRPNYHVFLGFRAATEGQTEAARAHFGAALEHRPDDAPLLNAIAYQLALDGIELNEAERHIQRALRLEPANPNYLDTLGWIWCRQGRFQLGLPALRAAVFLSHAEVEEINDHVLECDRAAIQ